jgi:2-oxoglutarate dehydrogenase E2 component (dihydrolipoamide succinyltransferase)
VCSHLAGVVVQWAKDVGDIVEAGDVLAVIETDKVSIDIRADVRGKLTARHAAVDDKLEVGAPLYTLDTEGAPAVEQPPQPERTPQPKAEDSAT